MNCAEGLGRRGRPDARRACCSCSIRWRWLPVFLAYLARYAFDNQTVFYGILALAAALGVAVYWMAMESAVAAARNRRETIVAELSRGEGPLVSE